MRRLAVAALAVLIIASPVLAQEQARIFKGDTRALIPHEAPEGWRMKYLPILPEMLAELRAEPKYAAKKIIIAATYTSISLPDIGGGIDAFDVTPLSSLPYWQGVVLFNLAGTRIVKVKVKATGASKQTLQGTFSVPGGSVVVISGQFDPFGDGVVFIKTTATGARAVKSAVCAGC